MSGMEIPLAVAAVGSTAASTFASGSALGKSKQATLMAAQEQANAQEFEGRQLDLQGKRIRSAAAVDEASRREDLMSSLDTIDVLRVGRGLDPDSPTGRAIAKGVTERGERNIAQSKTNYLLQAANSEMQGELSRRKARYSMLAGEAGASAIDDQIMATYAGGVGKVAGIGMSFAKMPVTR
jgi:hypothetical protein